MACSVVESSRWRATQQQFREIENKKKNTEYEEELEDLYYDSNRADDDDDITTKLPDYLIEYKNWRFRWEFEEYNLNEFQIIEMELNKSYFYD